MAQTPSSTNDRPGALQRLLYLVPRFLRRNWTRENLIQCFKTFASVGPLTLLIWVYAEREDARTESNISIPIEVRCTDPHRIVSLQKPYPDKVIVVNLSGPRSTLDVVIARLERLSGEQAAVEIFVDDPHLSTGMVHEIDARTALTNNPMFRGIAIDSCQPSQLEVALDELGEQDIEVQAPPDITNLVGPPSFTPRTVKVRGPKPSMDKLSHAQKLVAIADLGSFDAMNIPGQHDLSVVRIKPLDDPSLTFYPPNVDAAVSVRESDVPGVIRSVPIWIGGPPELMQRFHVDLANAVLTNVKVTGPKDKIDLVNQPDYSPKPHAMLEIRFDDEAGKPLQRKVKFDFGDLGLHVSDETVDFRLVEAGATHGE